MSRRNINIIDILCRNILSFAIGFLLWSIPRLRFDTFTRICVKRDMHTCIKRDSIKLLGAADGPSYDSLIWILQLRFHQRWHMRYLGYTKSRYNPRMCEHVCVHTGWTSFVITACRCACCRHQCFNCTRDVLDTQRNTLWRRFLTVRILMPSNYICNILKNLYPLANAYLGNSVRALLNKENCWTLYHHCYINC